MRCLYCPLSSIPLTRSNTSTACSPIRWASAGTSSFRRLGEEQSLWIRNGTDRLHILCVHNSTVECYTLHASWPYRQQTEKSDRRRWDSASESSIREITIIDWCGEFNYWTEERCMIWYDLMNECIWQAPSTADTDSQHVSSLHYPSLFKKLLSSILHSHFPPYFICFTVFSWLDRNCDLMFLQMQYEEIYFIF